MPRPLRCLRATLMAATILAPAWAHAQDTTGDQAAQMEVQLRTWLTGLLGPTLPVGDRPIRVTPEGDHFVLSVPIAGPIPGTASTVTADPLSIAVKPIGSGRWSILEFPTPGTIRVDNAKPGPDGVKSTTTHIDSRTATGVIDTTLTTDSTLESGFKGYSAAFEREQGGPVLASLASYLGHTLMHPIGNGRIDLSGDGSGQTVAVEGAMDDGSKFRFTMDRMSLGVHMKELAPDQIGPLIQALLAIAPPPPPKPAAAPVVAPVAAPGGNPDVVATAKQGLAEGLRGRPAATAAARPGARPPAPVPPPRTVAPLSGPVAVVPAAPAAPAKAELTPEEKVKAHHLLAVFRAALSGLDENVAMENLKFVSQGQTGTLAKAAFEFGAGAVDGKADFHTTMSFDGFDSPAIPPGIYRDYVPTHLSLKPHLSGIPVDALFALADHAIDAGEKEQEALGAEAMGLLAKGPLNVGLDELALAMGPATLNGSGNVAVGSITDIKGHGLFTMTGLDDLMKQVTATKELAQFGVGPVLLLAKGMGRADGTKTIWDITYEGGKVLVNGTDLSNMIPAMK